VPRLLNTKSVKSSIKLIAVLVAISGQNLSAQTSMNELSFYAGGGFSTIIQHVFSNNSSSKGFGGEAGLGFTFFIDRHQTFGIHIGAGAGLYDMRTTINELNNITRGLVDANNYLFDLHTTLYNYNETQRAFFFTTSIMLQYQSALQSRAQRQRFYAKGGVKLMFNNARYNIGISELVNISYYPALNNWAGTQRFAGLGSFSGQNSDGDFRLNILPILALEAGRKWRLGYDAFLYAGVFFEYALRDPFENNRKPISNFTHSEHLENLTVLQTSNRQNFATVGIRLRVAFKESTKPRPITRPRVRGHCP